MRQINFKSLYLKNFKVHEEISLDLSENKFIIISGLNGSGKTSIFDGLYWILYDKTLKGLKGDEVIRHRSGKNTSGILIFQIDNDEYEIKNYIKDDKHGNNKYLYKNGSDITKNSRKETNEIIEKILMPSNIFLNCLMFSQLSSTKSFTDMTHGEQKEILDKLLNLEIYDNYHKNAGEKIKQNEEEIIQNNIIVETLKGIIATIKENINDSINEKQSLINTQEIELTNLGKEIQDIENYLNSNINIIEKYTKLKEEYNNFKEEKLHINSKLEKEKNDYYNEIDKSHNLLQQDKNKELNQINEQFLLEKSNIQKVLISLDETRNKDTSLYNNECAELIKKYSNNEDIIKQKYEDELKSDIEEKQKLEKDLSELTASYRYKKETKEKIQEELDKLLSSLNKKNPVCPLCKQEIKHAKLIEELNIKKENLTNDILNLDSELKIIIENGSNKKSTLYDLNNKISCKQESFKYEITELTNNKTKEQSKFDQEFSEKIKGILLEIENSKSELSKIDNTNTIKEVNDKYLKLEEQYKLKIKEKYRAHNDNLLKHLNDINTKLSIIEVDLQKIEKQKEEYQNECSKLQLKQEQIPKIKTDYNNRINNITLKITENENRLKEKELLICNNKIKNDSILEEIEILKFWRIAFSDTGIKALIMDECIPILNNKAKELCSIFPNLKVNFDSQTMLKSGEQRDKFSINVLNTKNLSKLEELSSGESRIVNLIVLICLRYLLENMQDIKINILLFDEALEHLDPENTEIILEVFRNLSEEYLVTLITHTHRDSVECDEILSL